MKIVIDIPEDVLKRTVFYREFRDLNDCVTTIKALENGIPLPKGHGRLIDADRIITEATERMKYPANHQYMECVIAHMKLAPTIIEADKAESEVRNEVNCRKNLL